MATLRKPERFDRLYTIEGKCFRARFSRRGMGRLYFYADKEPLRCGVERISYTLDKTNNEMLCAFVDWLDELADDAPSIVQAQKIAVLRKREQELKVQLAEVRTELRTLGALCEPWEI